MKSIWTFDVCFLLVDLQIKYKVYMICEIFVLVYILLNI